MSTTQERLRPWAERTRAAGIGQISQPQDDLEEQAAALFRRVEVAVHFNPERVPLAVLGRRRPSSAPLRYAVAASVLLVGSAGAVAAVRRLPDMPFWIAAVGSSDKPKVRAVAPVPAPDPVKVAVAPEPPAAPTESPAEPAQLPVMMPPPPRRRAKARPHRTVALASRPTVETFAVDPLPAELSVEDLLGPAAPAEAPAPLAAPSPGAESQLSRETRLLQRAYAQLRSEDDPSAALDTLDEYLNAHPLGLLRKEATSARIETLLKLRRSNEALVVLRTFPFGEGAKDTELRVVRGELTAASRDCQGAIPDFVAVSDKVAPDDVIERALYGLAACEARLGQRADAASSFRVYLRRFPAGRFAAEARRQLGSDAK